jgi:mannose-6-phosphate isomerase
MTIERARLRAVCKPWGSTDLRPWSKFKQAGMTIGELWFERIELDAPSPALLLKLLFTTEALSIQVHPDDGFARSIGLPHGKSEAWYILSAAAGAKVALDLQQPLNAGQLRNAISDGSIAGLVNWRTVRTGEFIAVPAGTIHAIGADLVIAEIQQRSDATFRLFDFGRQRDLHIENSVAAALARPAEPQAEPSRLTLARTLLLAKPYFIVEEINLQPMSSWCLRAKQETWLLVIGGHARFGLSDAAVGEALFLEAETASIDVGPDGLKGLMAYPGPAVRAELLEAIDARDADVAPRLQARKLQDTQAAAPSPNHAVKVQA